MVEIDIAKSAQLEDLLHVDVPEIFFTFTFFTSHNIIC